MKKSDFNNPNLFKILFIASVGMLLFIAALNYRHNQNIENSTDKVLRIHKVNFELEKIISSITDAQREMVGYLLTRDKSFLVPYANSQKKVTVAFKTVYNLTAKNSVQQKNIYTLATLVDKKYSNFEQTLVYINKNSNYSETNLRNKIKFDKLIMDEIINLAEKMVKIENSYLQKSNSVYNYQLFLNPLFSIGTIFITLFFLVISYIKINDDVKILQQSNDNLLFFKTSNDQSEILGGYSSWLWNLDTNEMTFSDNQYRLLGHEPQSFEASNANFLKFVHPDDIETVEKIIDTILIDEDLPTVYYRIIRKDTKIRYYKSVGTLINDRFKNKIIIGNTCDITDERLAKLDVEVRNLELEQSNNELISFNYVASHDLQEPLRKIQTFISRFSAVDLDNLSDNGKGYFSKISTSIARMRELIDDLLLYSRTSKADKKFELFDLNLILERTEQELSQIITDSNTKIISDELPVLEIIPFQMQQLFVNIIGNSIKYAKKGQSPIVTITSEKINAAEYPILIKPVATTYYKISFSDNGIGFDEQYAERVFILFNRLISDKEYHGSGIGLTICKKIAENHAGHLTAQSKIGEGATFTFFIPIF